MKAILFGGVMLASAGARAAAPDERLVATPDARLASSGRLQVQGQLMGGSTFGSQGDPYGLGLGVGAGFTLPMGLYLGASYARFEGSKVDILGSNSPIHASAIQAEVGYDFGFGEALVLRPKFGFGSISVVAELCKDGECDELGGAELGLTPAVELAYVVGNLIASAQVRVFVDPDDDTFSGYALGIGLGAAL